MSDRYTVFVRNWYRREVTAYGSRIVPNPGARKTTLAKGLTETEARDMCKRYNETHKPGPLSRKAEYRSE